MPIRVPRVTGGITPVVPQAPQDGIAQVAPVQDPAADSQVADQAALLAEQIYREDRDREIRSRVNELDERRVKADREVVDGFLALQGKNAVDGRADVLRRIRSNGKSVLEGVTDAAVRESYRDMNRAHSERAIQRVESHYRQQNRVFQRETQESRRDLYVDEFVRERVARHDDELDSEDAANEAARAQSAYREAVRALGESEGWSEETVTAELRAADGKADGLVVQELVRQGRLEEAEEVLGQGRVDPDNETRLRAGLERAKTARAEADVAEQGYQLADQLIREHGSPARQLEEARRRYSDGDAPFGVMRAATAEIARRANERHTLRAREGGSVLEDVQRWSQSNRHQGIDQAQRERLRTAGVEREYDLWRLQGGHFITTTAGYELLDTISNAEFLEHEDFATLRSKHRMDLSEKHMAALRADWEQAWNAAGRAAPGSGGGGSAGKPLSVTRTVVGFLRERSSLFDEFNPLDKESQNRVQAFEDAVQRRLATSAGKDDQAARDAAVRAVWNEGGILDGEWMPFEMATRDERERMRQAFVPADRREPGFIGPLQNENGVRRVVPGDFDRGGPFSDLRDQDTGRPDFEEFLDRDTDPASISDGLVVVQPGNEGVARTVHRDPVTGEALAETRSRVPGYEEIAAKLFEQGVPPTPDQVAAVQADLIAQNERANQRAAKQAPIELQLRRDKFLTDLKGEYELMVARLAAEDAERVQAPRDEIARIVQANPGAKVSEGRSFTAVRIGKRTHYINNPPDPRPLEDLEVAAWARLKAKHRKALAGYGVAVDGFFGGPRESDPVWRLFHGQPMDPNSEVLSPFGVIPDAALPEIGSGNFIWEPNAEGAPGRSDG